MYGDPLTIPQYEQLKEALQDAEDLILKHSSKLVPHRAEDADGEWRYGDEFEKLAQAGEGLSEVLEMLEKKMASESKTYRTRGSRG